MQGRMRATLVIETEDFSMENLLKVLECNADVSMDSQLNKRDFISSIGKGKIVSWNVYGQVDGV